MNSVRVKICGFTRSQDVDAACALGCDALGFNLALGPRRLGLDQAAALVRRVPPAHLAIALFVDADETTILAALQATRCQAVQLHGSEPPELAAALGRRLPVIKAFRIRSPADLASLAGYPADAYLLDAASPGSGQTWDHAWLAGQDPGRPVMLAGGLHPGNVADAIVRLRPWAVDTASGVEAGPGLKEVHKMQAFITAARNVVLPGT